MSFGEPVLLLGLILVPLAALVYGALQRRKLIHYRRGDLEICDVRGLEAVACRCYGDAKKTYARVLN